MRDRFLNLAHLLSSQQGEAILQKRIRIMAIDLYVVSKLLAHSSVTVTQTRYGHLQTDRIAEGLKKTFG